MPTDDKQTPGKLSQGDRILVWRDRAGAKLEPARSRTLHGVVVATVQTIDTAKVFPKGSESRRGQLRYTIMTDLGPVEEVAPALKFLMATPEEKPAKAKAKPPVPPAQFKPAELVTADSSGQTRVVTRPQAPPEPVQMPPGFVNGQRAYEATPEGSQARCVDRSGCEEAATQQVVGRRHIRYCPRHGAEFEVRQQYMVDPWKLEAIR